MVIADVQAPVMTPQNLTGVTQMMGKDVTWIGGDLYPTVTTVCAAVNAGLAS